METKSTAQLIGLDEWRLPPQRPTPAEPLDDDRGRTERTIRP